MIYKIWASARRTAAQDWARGHQQAWAWGKRAGRGAAEAAWQSALLGERARAEGLSASAIAFDCSKCHDKVDLRKAAEALREEEFPGALAGDVVSTWKKTARRLMPGCGLATHILTCYLASVARGVEQVEPEVKLKLYVDDSRLQAEGGCEQEVARGLAGAARNWIAGVEKKDGVVNADKTVALATSAKMQRAMKEALEGARIKVVLGRRDLGVDDALARRRRAGVLAARLRKVASKAARLQKLTRVTRKADCTQRPGLDAAASYGSSAVGLANDQILGLRKQAARPCPKYEARACLTTALATTMGLSDPWVRMAGEIAKVWPLRIWKADSLVRKMEEAWPWAFTEG
eukprot:10696871-Alexandrium_andersonii.AAC.3